MNEKKGRKGEEIKDTKGKKAKRRDSAEDDVKDVAELRLISICTVSGGFATVQPGSKLSINAVEGYPLEDFSAEVRSYQIIQKRGHETDEQTGCQVPDRRGTEDCRWQRQ